VQRILRTILVKVPEEQSAREVMGQLMDAVRRIYIALDIKDNSLAAEETSLRYHTILAPPLGLSTPQRALPPIHNLLDLPRIGAAMSPTRTLTLPRQSPYHKDEPSREQDIALPVYPSHSQAGPKSPARIESTMSQPSFSPQIPSTVDVKESRRPASEPGRKRRRKGGVRKATRSREASYEGVETTPYEDVETIPYEDVETIPYEDVETMPYESLEALVWEPRVVLVPGSSSQYMLDAALRFQEKLYNTLFTGLWKNNKRVPDEYLDGKTVVTLTRFLFRNVFGEACQQRMIRLREELTDNNASGAVSRLDERAEGGRVAVIDEFETSLDQFRAIREKQTRVRPMITGHLARYHVFLCGLALRKIAARPDTDPAKIELKDYLLGNGFDTRQGVGVKTCVNRYIIAKLQSAGWETLNWSNAMQAQVIIHTIVQIMGKGILVLLPEGAVSATKWLGVGKGETIVRLLAEVLPQAKDVCASAEHLLEYIPEDAPRAPLLVLE
jgi:hypothetical protein